MIMIIGRIGYALWLGLTIYLFQIAVPRPLDWTIIGPIGAVIVSYVTLTRSRKREQKLSETGPAGQGGSGRSGEL